MKMLRYLEYYESKSKDFPGFFVSPFPGTEFEPQGPFATLELAKQEAEKIAREYGITDREGRPAHEKPGLLTPVALPSLKLVVSFILWK